MSISVVYWSGTGNTQAMAEAIAAGANSRLARQQMEQMLSLQEKIINDTGGSSTISVFLNSYRKKYRTGHFGV